jgi:hypothetical protein
MAQINELLRANFKGGIVIAGTFFPDATNAPTVTTATGGWPSATGILGGPGWRVARTGVGLYTITLENRYYPVLMFKHLTCQWNAVQDLVPQFGAFTAATSTTDATIIVRLATAAVVTEAPAANANNSISFCLALCETEKPGG